MSRAVWFVAGAGAGVYAMTRARRAVEAFTPEGLADRLAGLAVGLHLFRDEVAAGMAERETGLRERLGIGLPGGPGRPGSGHHLDGLDTPLDRLDTPLDELDHPQELDPSTGSGQRQVSTAPTREGND